MSKPIISAAGKHTILTYELPSIATLCKATNQVYSLLRAISGRDEFFILRKSTTIKIDNNGEGKHALRMHFIIPVKTMDHAVLHAILENDTIAAETN